MQDTQLDSFSMHLNANWTNQQMHVDKFRLLIHYEELSMDYVVIVQQDQFHQKQ